MNAVTEMPAPLIFTDNAAGKVKQLIEEEGNTDLKLRVFVSGGGCSGFQYGFTFDELRIDAPGSAGFDDSRREQRAQTFKQHGVLRAAAAYHDPLRRSEPLADCRCDRPSGALEQRRLHVPRRFAAAQMLLDPAQVE